MRIKKIMLFISLFFIAFLLYSCKKSNYQIKRIYFFQDTTDYEKYNVLTEKVSLEKRGNIDINKFVSKDLSGFSYENYQNAASKTKITGSDSKGYICNIYYNLKEYTVKYTIKGQTKEAPRKYRYLEKINIRELTKDYQSEFFNLTTGKIIQDEFLVDSDIDLIAQDGPYNSEFKKLFLKVSNQLDGLTFDDTLKSPEAYFKNTKVVLKESYDKFIKSFSDFKKALKDGNISEKLEAFSKLSNISDSIDKEIVKGKKEYSSDDINSLEKEFKKIVDEIKENLNILDGKFSKAIKVSKVDEDELKKHNKDQFLLEEKIYSEVSDILRSAKNDVVVKTFSKTNVEKSKANLNILKNDIANLKNAISLYDSKGQFGKKELKNATYKIEIYKDGALDKTKEEVAYENKLVRLNPESLEHYYIDSKSVLFGVNDGKLVLKVYYSKQNLLVRIDTDGGVNKFYDKSYIEVKYNTTIDNDIVGKIKKVSKEDDKFGKNYRFLKYVDFYTNEEVDFTKPLTKSQIIKAIYEKDMIAPFNYDIEFYVDKVDSKTLEAEYSTFAQTTVKSTNKVNVGDLVAFSPNDMPAEYRNGFEIDMDKSVLSYGKIGLGDKLKVYLKRKLLRVDLDTSYKDKKAIIEDERIVNNKLSIKYGSIFNIYPEKAMIELENNKVAIFDKLVDADTNLEYELGKTVDRNLNLKIVYKEVDKTNLTKISFTKGYIGKKILNDKEVEENLYIEKNSKIKDPAFFENTTSDSVASLDLENKIGFIKDKSDIFKEINKDTVFTKSEYTLEFIYRMTLDKMENLKKELFKEQKYLKARDKEFEIKGKITAIFETSKQYFIETEDGMVLARVSGTLSMEQYDKLKVNNVVSISGKLNQNFSDIYSSKIDYKVGRFTDYILSVDNTTRISLITIASDNTEDIKELGDNLKDAKSLIKANVSNLTVLDTMGKVATNVPGYDDGVAISKYYTYKVVDKYANISYLHIAEDDPMVKYFLDLSEGDIINIKGAYLINARVNRKGIPAFNDGSTKAFLGIFITKYNSQVEYLLKDKKMDVNLNITFEKYENWTTFENRNKKYELYENTNLETIIKDYFEYNIFNGYKIKTVKVNNIEIESDKYSETKLKNNDNVEIIMDKALQYLNFYYGTYLPKELIPNIKLIAHKGGMEYTTYPVDYDEGFYRFVLAYDKKDLYTELIIKYTDDVSKKIILNLANKNPSDIRSFAAMETCKYSLIHGGNSSLGNLDLNSISYEWGDILPEEILKNNKGLFVHPFSLDGPSGSYAEEYADRSLYSAILLENSNIASPDGEKNINKDHNMLSNYTQYDGNRFYQFDGNLSQSDINSSTKFNIRAFIKMYLKDTDENGIDYTTNRVVKYYFHKSSFSKYARFNKFGLGYLFADLTPFINGKLLSSKGLISELSAKEQGENELAKSDTRIIKSLPEFLEYLRKNNVKSYDNIFKNLRQYDKLTFNIVEENDLSFKNGQKTIDVIKKVYDEITPDELGINNPSGKKLLFVDLDTMEIINFKYIYENKKIKRYGIITYDERDIEISVLENSKNISKTKLIKSNYGEYLFESSGNISGVLKTHRFKMPYNKDFPQLFKYFKHSDGLLESLDYDYNFKISIASESSKYIYFATSKEITPIKNGYKKFILTVKNNDNPDFKNEVLDYVLKVVDKNNETKIYPLSGMIYDNLGYFMLDYINPSDYKTIDVYKNNSLNNKVNTNKITLENKPYTIKLIDRDSGGKVVRFKNISDNADKLFNYKKITINPINLMWNDNSLGLSKVEYLYSYNLPNKKIKLRHEIFNNFYNSKYEMTFTYVIDGVERDLDIHNPVVESGSDILINIYYKLKYKPGEYYKISLNFGKGDSYSGQNFGYIDALKDRLYRGKEFYVKKDEPLDFLKNVAINSDWQNYKSFVNWKKKNGSMLGNNESFDGSENIELTAKYTDSASHNIIKKEIYIENVNTKVYDLFKKEQFILNKSENSYTLNKDLLNNLIKGYEIDMDKSVLKLDDINSLPSNKRLLKVYYKAKKYDISLNLNGGKISQEGINYLESKGFVKTGDVYKKTISYGDDIYKIIYEFISQYNLEKNDVKSKSFNINDDVLIKYNILKPGENLVSKNVMISFNY